MSHIPKKPAVNPKAQTLRAQRAKSTTISTTRNISTTSSLRRRTSTLSTQSSKARIARTNGKSAPTPQYLQKVTAELIAKTAYVAQQSSESEQRTKVLAQKGKEIMANTPATSAEDKAEIKAATKLFTQLSKQAQHVHKQERELMGHIHKSAELIHNMEDLPPALKLELLELLTNSALQAEKLCEATDIRVAPSAANLGSLLFSTEEVYRQIDQMCNNQALPPQEKAVLMVIRDQLGEDIKGLKDTIKTLNDISRKGDYGSQTDKIEDLLTKASDRTLSPEGKRAMRKKVIFKVLTCLTVFAASALVIGLFPLLAPVCGALGIGAMIALVVVAGLALNAGIVSLVMAGHFAGNIFKSDPGAETRSLIESINKDLLSLEPSMPALENHRPDDNDDDPDNDDNDIIPLLPNNDH